MKITKTELKQIIKEELSKIMEDKQEHIAGIARKIERLENEIDRATAALEKMEAGAAMPGASEDENYYNLMDLRVSNEYMQTRDRISSMNDKIDLLLKQAQQLKQDSPGQLERV
tara:strand:- start:398 stop:739 length:342 start_codon:yes stop_codon:yes gene_type:complete